MKKIVFLAALVLFTSCIAQAQNIVGDWQGTLKTGAADLRLVLHIAKGDGDSLKATLDSVDQGANGIPVTSISLKDSKLNFSVDAVNGSYAGKVNSDGTMIGGTWYQGQPMALDFKRAPNVVKAEKKPAKPSDIDGTWLATLDIGANKLHLAFHITNTQDGLTAAVDSLDQGANGIPAATVTRNGSSLKMEFRGIGGTFEGTIDKGLATVDGTWTQSGSSFPLVLKRAKDAA